MTGRHSGPAAQGSAPPSEALPTAVPSSLAQRGNRGPLAASLLTRPLLVTNALLLVLLAFQMFHRTRYEYTTVSPSDYTFDQEMNKLGAGGWKTESCRRASSGSNTDSFSYECIMSRPKLGW